MMNGRSSRTAEYMAFFRALESVRDTDKRLFHDPFAANFLRPNLRKAVSYSKNPLFRAGLNWYVDKRMPGARTSAIARTRLIDDRLREVLATGIKQVVILGAGFDCRSIRLPDLRRATVFEVDHLDTLRVKRNCLTQIAPFVSSSVQYVGIDFNRESVSEALGKAGFDRSRITVFLWEGVTNYLTEEAVDSVLRVIADCQSGSQIIFTFVHSGVLDGSVKFHGSDRLIRDVAGVGEPWTFGINPRDLSTFLSRRGFRLDEDLPADDYRPLYYGASARNIKGYGFYHVAVAELVASQAPVVIEQR
jgi:methyltransferase (TIGR00027 family)